MAIGVNIVIFLVYCTVIAQPEYLIIYCNTFSPASHKSSSPTHRTNDWRCLYKPHSIHSYTQPLSPPFPPRPDPYQHSTPPPAVGMCIKHTEICNANCVSALRFVCVHTQFFYHARRTTTTGPEMCCTFSAQTPRSVPSLRSQYLVQRRRCASTGFGLRVCAPEILLFVRVARTGQPKRSGICKHNRDMYKKYILTTKKTCTAHSFGKLCCTRKTLQSKRNVLGRKVCDKQTH